MVVVLACVTGISQLKLEDNFVEYFDESYEFRRDTDYAEERLTGLYLLEFPIDSGQDQGINDPKYLQTVSNFTDWLRDQPEIVNVRSLTDTVKRLNMNMHGDDRSMPGRKFWIRRLRQRRALGRYDCGWLPARCLQAK